ncbi:hypothetical protein LHU53_12890 [Rhodoferax sp. U2-2l]|uniref:hypothetical protein n=1 Tax=Rhodoferax sp. U2-2l TaxID=2884000 RepID=UPI001D0A404F|nr:hypothetical protein [Rhodoferax sp. U2-2l]MCB8747800.1 hypothetical protein [Rhodoferax sp. U2-2l]
MWTAKVNRREFFEFYMGSTKNVESRVSENSQINVQSGSDLVLVWESHPLERIALPNLVIVTDGDIQSLLSAVIAAPQVPSPITALSRVITQEEAKQHFDSDTLPLNERVFPALAALIFVEAVLHGDGRLGLKQLTPLICKRTLAYAWGKAMGSCVAPESFIELPERWLDVYSMLNTPSAIETANRTVDSVVSGLSLLAQLTIGIKPNTAPGALAFELLNNNKDDQEVAWQRLAAHLPRSVSIEDLHSLAREERGLYLQDALRSLASISSRAENQEMTAACAFLATRIAPGSLEHLDVLKSASKPELLAWYAIYAALQNPKEILSLHGGLGFRLMRDLLRVEEKLAPPIADISYTELKIVARAGLDAMAGRIGHASELQVEIVPYVSTSFTFQSRNRPRWGEGQASLDTGHFDSPPVSPRARAISLANELAKLVRDLPDYSDDSSPKGRSRSKPG